jgi:rSAM/selenodomain-associated transferase 1
MSDGRILVFAKAPIPGKAKTRLIPALGMEGAAELHAQLVLQTLDRICKPGGTPVELWCTPTLEHDFFRACASEYDLQLKSQRGEDLGARMYSAFESTLTTCSWAILLGTDCPDLNYSDIQKAIELLHNGNDAVIGPAHDGGYYLLGLRQPLRKLFADLPWGTDKVWDVTRKHLERLGCRYATLRVQHDLDRPEDLQRFPELLNCSPGLR